MLKRTNGPTECWQTNNMRMPNGSSSGNKDELHPEFEIRQSLQPSRKREILYESPNPRADGLLLTGLGREIIKLCVNLALTVKRLGGKKMHNIHNPLFDIIHIVKGSAFLVSPARLV